jgi:Flp pilus assembly protein TadG
VLPVNRVRRLLKEQQAQALVELALVLPVLLLLVFGIIEFGRIYGAYMVISNLSREGARFGVVGHDDSQIEALITQRRAWLDEQKLIITVTPSYAERDKGDALNVEVDYSVVLLTPILGEILPNPVPLSAQCIMRVE